MGGRIARNFAAPARRLRSLVLAGTSPGFEGLDVKRFVAERRTATPESVRRLLGERGCRRVRKPHRQRAACPSGVVREDAEASVAQDRAAPLEQIRVPTLVLTGDEDSVYPPAWRATSRAASRAPSWWC